MALSAQVRFLTCAEIGRQPEGVITLRAVLPDGSERDVDACAARFGPSAPPLQVTLVLDTSGSMAPHESLLRLSSATLLRLLPVGVAQVRVLTFDTSAKEVKGVTRIASSEDTASLVAITNQLCVSRGNTNLYDAMTKLSPLDMQHFVVLLSDGFANVGPTDDAELGCAAREILAGSTAPVLITPIGFNSPDQLQMKLLNTLASMTDGTVHVVQHAERVLEAFGDVISDMVGVLAGNVKLQHADTTAVVNTRFLEKDKIGGIHVRVGAPRHVPFRGEGRVTLTYWDVLSASQKTLEVDIPEAPLEQDMDWDVHEALLMARSAEVLEAAQAAKNELLVQFRALGPSPRGSYVFPYSPSRAAGAGTGAGGVLSQAADDCEEHSSQDSEPPAKRAAMQGALDRMHEDMRAAWTRARQTILDDTWTPVVMRLTSLLSDVDCNPRKGERKLRSLRDQLQALLNTDVEHSLAFDDIVSGLGHHLVSQRSGVVDGEAALGSLDVDATHSQMAARLVTRTLSQRPDASSSSARLMLNKSLAEDPEETKDE